MLIRRLLIIFWLTLMSLLGMAACTPSRESEVGSVVSLSATETISSQVQSSDGVVVAMPPISATQLVSNQVQSSDGAVVAMPPISATQLAVQPLGQSEPGAGAANKGPQAEPEAQGGQSQPGTMVVYADSTYKFSVGYPADFVFRTQPAEKLAQFTPMPTASFIFMNPVTAASDLGDLEPADLEIRVYGAGQTTSLDDWLTANSLLPTDCSVPLKPFQTANVSGVQVCASTMMALACSYFVMDGGWVYQLTPATLEGETMVGTFIKS